MKAQDTPTRGPLTGIRVIELADEQAEYCGLTLAGLGADVVKVEPPGGKRSIVLDLNLPNDRDRFRALVATADVRGRR